MSQEPPALEPEIEAAPSRVIPKKKHASKPIVAKSLIPRTESEADNGRAIILKKKRTRTESESDAPQKKARPQTKEVKAKAKKERTLEELDADIDILSRLITASEAPSDEDVAKMKELDWLDDDIEELKEDFEEFDYGLTNKLDDFTVTAVKNEAKERKSHIQYTFELAMYARRVAETAESYLYLRNIQHIISVLNKWIHGIYGELDELKEYKTKESDVKYDKFRLKDDAANPVYSWRDWELYIRGPSEADEIDSSERIALDLTKIVFFHWQKVGMQAYCYAVIDKLLPVAHENLLQHVAAVSSPTRVEDRAALVANLKLATSKAASIQREWLKATRKLTTDKNNKDGFHTHTSDLSKYEPEEAARIQLLLDEVSDLLAKSTKAQTKVDALTAKLLNTNRLRFKLAHLEDTSALLSDSFDEYLKTSSNDIETTIKSIGAKDQWNISQLKTQLVRLRENAQTLAGELTETKTNTGWFIDYCRAHWKNSVAASDGVITDLELEKWVWQSQQFLVDIVVLRRNTTAAVEAMNKALGDAGLTKEMRLLTSIIKGDNMAAISGGDSKDSAIDFTEHVPIQIKPSDSKPTRVEYQRKLRDVKEDAMKKYLIVSDALHNLIGSRTADDPQVVADYIAYLTAYKEDLNKQMTDAFDNLKKWSKKPPTTDDELDTMRANLRSDVIQFDIVTASDKYLMNLRGLTPVFKKMASWSGVTPAQRDLELNKVAIGVYQGTVQAKMEPDVSELVVPEELLDADNPKFWFPEVSFDDPKDNRAFVKFESIMKEIFVSLKRPAKHTATVEKLGKVMDSNRSAGFSARAKWNGYEAERFQLLSSYRSIRDTLKASQEFTAGKNYNEIVPFRIREIADTLKNDTRVLAVDEGELSKQLLALDIDSIKQKEKVKAVDPYDDDIDLKRDKSIDEHDSNDAPEPLPSIDLTVLDESARNPLRFIDVSGVPDVTIVKSKNPRPSLLEDAYDATEKMEAENESDTEEKEVDAETDSDDEDFELLMKERKEGLTEIGSESEDSDVEPQSEEKEEEKSGDATETDAEKPSANKNGRLNRFKVDDPLIDERKAIETEIRKIMGYDESDKIMQAFISVKARNHAGLTTETSLRVGLMPKLTRIEDESNEDFKIRTLATYNETKRQFNEKLKLVEHSFPTKLKHYGLALKRPVSPSIVPTSAKKAKTQSTPKPKRSATKPKPIVPLHVYHVTSPYVPRGSNRCYSAAASNFLTMVLIAIA